MAGGHQRRALIVDDEPHLRGFVGLALRAHGYTVEEAEDGQEALDTLARPSSPADHLCVVVLDMGLPMIDGASVLRHLMTSHDAPPIVAVSAAQERLAEARAAGAHATLAKPFSLDVLLETITSVARC